VDILQTRPALVTIPPLASLSSPWTVTPLPWIVPLLTFLALSTLRVSFFSRTAPQDLDIPPPVFDVSPFRPYPVFFETGQSPLPSPMNMGLPPTFFLECFFFFCFFFPFGSSVCILPFLGILSQRPWV